MTTRSIDMGGMGPDPTEEYTGDSMEDFYQYLLTPRHHKSWGGSGAIRHFGPSRTASVRPEDAAMADLIMQQMMKDQEREYTADVYESDLARRAAADELMMPEGRGGGVIQPAHGYTNLAGGSGAPIQVGGGLPEGPQGSRGPLSREDEYVLQAGGVETPRGETASRQGEGYNDGGRRSTGRTAGQGDSFNKTSGQYEYEMAEAGNALRELARQERGWGNMSVEDILKRAQENPNDIPEFMYPALDEFYARANRYKAWVENAGGGGGPTDRGQWKPGG